MQKPLLLYCYDAWCGWCYGFSNVIVKISEEFSGQMQSDVLSGGMVLPEKPVHIKATANYVKENYRNVEDLTGAKFGQDYLWHINNPELSDWYPDSLKPAIALCIFKESMPEKAIRLASEFQYALHYEGRDLTDDEAYRHLLEKYEINADDFYSKLRSKEYEEKARYEFALVKQLKVTGYPTVLIQVGDLKFMLVAQGYTDYSTLKSRIESVLSNLPH